MEPLSLLVLFTMAVMAGAINAAVGSGSLLTLPVLLAIGVPPGAAVRTNTIGMVFSTLGSSYGYRREIAAEKEQLAPLVITTSLCATGGALLLLSSPSGALDVVVPVLIVVALAMVVFQKPLTRALRGRQDRPWIAARGGEAADGAEDAKTVPSAASHDLSPYRQRGLVAAMGAASVYGGYFTAAQGVLYLGVLGIFTGRTMGSVNAVKNLLSLVVNVAAALVYLVAHLWWGAAVLWSATAAIAVGSLLGGYFGAHLAKRMPEWLLRGVIVLVALVALVRQVM